ncbi:crossover junction endodeoxyribonuclease RuvC [Patescibacteria group bacterium]|nr:crossover junction endodeoxyribonuclease RuvC [Patescibacteria group bacterium]
MLIIGIDPGTAITGFSVVKKTKDRKFTAVEYGCILTQPGKSAGERLKKIADSLNKLIKKHKPDLMAIENIYFFKNFKTAMPVSQARGVALLIAAQKKIPVCEITPLQMKMAIVGYGRADKKQVQKMVEKILELEKPIKSDDAADALGIAICGGLKTVLK